MAETAKPSIASFAGRDPDLAQGTPVSLRELRIQREFDLARDPDLRANLAYFEKSEADRREESSGGSSMVKQDKPKPELKPRSQQQVTRDAFEAAWLREQREARLAIYRADRVAANDQPAPQRGSELSR